MVLFQDVSAGVKLAVEVRGQRTTFHFEIARATPATRESTTRSLMVIADLLAERMTRPRGRAS